MTEKKTYPNPQFKSAEEERKYWEEHSPLAERYEGKVQRGHQKLSSYFALRLSGQEITRLRDAAAKKGLTISAYAREVLMSAVGKGEQSSKPITIEDLGKLLEQSMPSPMKESVVSLINGISIGDPEKPALLVLDAGQMKAFEDIAKVLLPLMLSIVGVTILLPESKQYAALRETVRT